MTLETEAVLDRRRMRRHITFWRGFAIFGAALAIGAMAFGSDKLAGVLGQQQIARVTIEGTISENRDQLKMLERIAEAKEVVGVLLFVNSPGGTTTGGEAIYDGLRNIAKTKPVVAQFGTMAASAGYIVGLGADHIVARNNTITGSIGVLVQWPEVAQLLDKVGVKMNEVKSGDLKASPSPFAPLDEGGRKVMQDMVSDSFRWFTDLVETRRGIKTANVPGLLAGRVFSGRDALNHNLVDQIGGEAEAVRWLEDVRHVPKDLKVVDWKPTSDSGWGLTSAISGAVSWLIGQSATAVVQLLGQDHRFATLGLDGLVSVWHPPEN